MMERSYTEIMNPLGEKAGRQSAHGASKRKRAAKPVIGLLNNSKLNVSFFLETVEGLLHGKGYETFNTVKPRTAAPCPDIDLLAERCDFVINAVAE